MFGTNIGKELGENINQASENIKTGAREVKEGVKNLGNIENAALHLKEGMIVTGLVLGASWIITSILKKL